MRAEELGVSNQEAIENYIDTPDKSAFYLKAFDKYDQKKGFEIVWSWWAFFFPLPFFIYRKLYMEAFVSFIPTIAWFLTFILNQSIFIYLILSIILSSVIYNKLYKELKIYLILTIVISFSFLPYLINTLIITSMDASFAIFFIYKRYQKVLFTAKQFDVKEDELLMALKDLGGINKIGVWIGILLGFLFSILLLYPHINFLYVFYLIGSAT